MSKSPDIQIRNPHLADRVRAEAKRRGINAVARVAAELLTERLTQIEINTNQNTPAQTAQG